MEELNPKEEEPKQPLTPEEDSEDEDLKFLDEDFEEEPEESEKPKGEEEPDGSKTALNILNAELKKKGLNKNFKSWDGVAKSMKQMDIAFAQKGMEEKQEEKIVQEPQVQKQFIPSKVIELAYPELKYIKDEIIKEHPGKNVLEVYEASAYYQKEALVRAENERNKERIANPSGNTEGKPEVDETEQKFLNNLPDKYKKK